MKLIAFAALWASGLIVLGLIARVSWMLLSVGWGFF